MYRFESNSEKLFFTQQGKKHQKIFRASLEEHDLSEGI